ncbi:hypothetical protein H0H81_011233 [Sphagnurus paluster]|uniref:Aminoglycoside phosphotransferase domain-containing protein n=1 Tax=Sphagnurus paluster TaxID=117069 RepID=A0A9P7GLI8_9AGAR|nr:hypothetical protein H0H81_011233 [Sphagnurus paluster]
MGSYVQIFIDDEDKPGNIPDFETITTQCFELGPKQATAINISGVRISVDKKSDGDVSDIWVKFGPNVTMGEARTQQFVAQYLEAENNHDVRAPRVYLAFTWGVYGYIVSEFIDGPMCDLSDAALVAPAVQALIAIPPPSSTPGPVGGGLIEHPFFIERQSSIQYESVKDLEDHVNGILYVTERKLRVRLRDEVAKYGLRLCPSDLKPVNFMKGKDGRIVAVDYAGYSFLPPSFFAMALRNETFAHELSTILQYPPCKNNGNALETASYAMVPFGTNKMGEEISLLSLLFPHARTPSQLYYTGLTKRLRALVL